MTDAIANPVDDVPSVHVPTVNGVNVCTYLLTQGARKNQQCGTKCAGQSYCSKHRGIMATRLGNQGVAAQPVPKTVYAEKPKTQKTELYFKGGTPKDWEKFDEGVIKGFVKPGNVKKTIPNFKDTDKGTMKGSMIIKHKGAYELDSEFVKKELGDKVKVYSRVL